jgi:hypothetical protein
VIVEVPGSAGAVQLTVDCPVPPVAVTPLGAPGRAVQVRLTVPGQPASALAFELDVVPVPPAPVVAPVIPWLVWTPHTVVDVATPAVNFGLEALLKLVRCEVDTHEEPAPPAPAPSDGRTRQSLPAPLPPP